MKLIGFLLFISSSAYASQQIGFAFLFKTPAAIAPTVSSIAPTSGTTAGGTSVTITGTGFVSGATATIGGTSCTSPSVASSTTLNCITGARSAGSVSATVTNPSTLSGTGGSYTYTAPLVANMYVAYQNTFSTRTYIHVPVNLVANPVPAVGTVRNIVNPCFAPGANNARTVSARYYCATFPSWVADINPTQYDYSLSSSCTSTNQLSMYMLGATVNEAANQALINSNCILLP